MKFAIAFTICWSDKSRVSGAVRVYASTLKTGIATMLEADRFNLARTAGEIVKAKIEALGYRVNFAGAPQADDLPFGGVCYEQIIVPSVGQPIQYTDLDTIGNIFKGKLKTIIVEFEGKQKDFFNGRI
jgi:phosphoribosylcarboxyaminoimidazole (NCAIR) mutase